MKSAPGRGRSNVSEEERGAVLVGPRVHPEALPAAGHRGWRGDAAKARTTVDAEIHGGFKQIVIERPSHRRPPVAKSRALSEVKASTPHFRFHGERMPQRASYLFFQAGRMAMVNSVTPRRVAV